MSSIEKTLVLFREVMQDATRVAIWFEILRTPEITAKELMKVVAIKKTAMYYHLSLLEEKGVISFHLDKKEKQYYIVHNFFELLVNKELKGKEKEIDLFFLHIINSLIQREITRVNAVPEDKYKREKKPIPVQGLWFCDAEKLAQVKDEFNRFWDKIKELDQDEGPEMIVNTKMVYFWGLIDFLL